MVRKEEALGRGQEQNPKVERAVGNPVERQATRDVSAYLLACCLYSLNHRKCKNVFPLDCTLK